MPCACNNTPLSIEACCCNIDVETGLDEVSDLAADDIVSVDSVSQDIEQPEILSSSDTLEESARNDVVTVPTTRQTVVEKKNKYLTWLETNWKWLLGLLAVVFGVLYFLRERLGNLFQFLRSGNREDELDLNHSMMSGTRRARDYSAVQSLQRDNKNGNELAEGISYIDLKDEDEDSDLELTEEIESELERTTVPEEVSDEIDYDDGSFVQNEVLSLEEEISELEDFDATNEADLTFDERFTRLIEEKDFSFARELLDFARHNEINDDRYHCERLRLLKAMDDEDGFYEYYYEIEAKIPGFPPKLQTEISQFVVQLAQAG